MTSNTATINQRNALYRTLWRWHFYAGLFVMPFILLLSVTGSIFLFKPQIERWEEANFRGLSYADAVTPSQQLQSAMRAYPGAQFESYRLPEHRGDAAMITLGLDENAATREVFVSPQGKMLGVLEPGSRIAEVVSEIHGSLLAGKVGSWLVELAGS